MSALTAFAVAALPKLTIAEKMTGTGGYLGLSAFHFKKLENDAGEMAGLTLMACTLAILCGL